MKLRKKLLLYLVGACMLFTGCGKSASTDSDESDKDGKVNESVGNIDSNKNNKGDKVNQLKVEDYIQSAIDYTNKIGGSGLVMDGDDNIYVTDKYTPDTDRLVKLYSVYGKDVKQLRLWGEEGGLLIVTKNGDVYNYTNLILQGKDVKDVLWKNNNVNVDADIIFDNGKYATFTDYSHEISDEYDLGKNAIAACKWRSRMICLDKDGNYECSGYWKNCEIKDWKNTVVLACKVNEETETATIAGISADGKVYATGDYADDILSWGELAYISMDDELIVGLKKDGTLVYTGELGDAYNSLETISNVKGVRLWRGELYAVTEKGVYSSYLSKEPEMYYVDKDKGGSGFGLKMDKDGKIYSNSDEGWQLTDYPQGNSENALGLCYYQLLKNYDTDTRLLDSFMMRDINNDGIDDVIVVDRNERVERIKAYTNYGYLVKIFGASSIDGYYPNAGIIESSTMMGISGAKGEYTDIKTGKVIASSSHNHMDGTSQYYDHITNPTETEVTEEEFNKLIEGYVKGEEIIRISMDEFYENTEENLSKVFLK